MTSNRTRFGIVSLLLSCALVAMDAWLGWNLLAGRDELQIASVQAAGCDSLADKIAKLQGAPVRVEERARTSSALAKLIESAAQQAGIASDRIVHVAPAEPRRIGDTPYLEQTTAVELRAVTLRQLIELSLSIGRSAPQLAIPSVAIRTPPGDLNSGSGPELWNVQLTLTAHVFAPRSGPLPKAIFRRLNLPSRPTLTDNLPP